MKPFEPLPSELPGPSPLGPTRPGRGGQLLVQLATAASRAAGNGLKGAFIDAELDLWYALQDRLRRAAAGVARA